MMRHLYLRFLVGALLVSVTSARGCSVCGDGYQVGSPSAITSVHFPEQTDNQFACSDLEVAGLEGLIPGDDCAVLPSLIFETCDCQNTKRPQSTNDFTDSLHGSGYSSQRRVKTWFAYPAINTSPPVSAPFVPVLSPLVGAPFRRPSASAPTAAPAVVAAPAAKPPSQSTPTYNVRPVSTTSYDPISNEYLPTSDTPPVKAPTSTSGSHSLILVLSVLASLGLFALVACRVAIRHGTQTRAMRLRFQAHGNGHQIQSTPTTLAMIPVLAQLKKQAQARRSQVLAVLFPDKDKPHELFSTRKLEGDDREGPISGRSLIYDEQSKHYVFCDDPAEATPCSICLEILVPEDDTVTSLCAHAYHRECIMNWLQGDHDECPNCRQLMWDPETYNMVDQQIKDHNSGGNQSSARSTMLSP